jgi:hypothetical protein
MFITFLPYTQRVVELRVNKNPTDDSAVPYIYDQVFDQLIELTRSSPHAPYWLGALKSKRWERIKLKQIEVEAITKTIKILEGN